MEYIVWPIASGQICPILSDNKDVVYFSGGSSYLSGISCLWLHGDVILLSQFNFSLGSFDFVNHTYVGLLYAHDQILICQVVWT